MLPPIFRRYTNELWYIFHAPFFFFVFMVVWMPFRSETDLDMGRSLFMFNVTMMMCIIIVTLLLTRTLRFLLARFLNRSWWQLLAWCVMELTAITFFLALYLYLMETSVPYSHWLPRCLEYSFLVLVFPYLAVTGVCALVAAYQTPARERELVRFADASRQVRLVLLKDVILYVKAQENYVRIYYLDSGNVKDYTIRSTMRAITRTLWPCAATGTMFSARSWTFPAPRCPSPGASIRNSRKSCRIVNNFFCRGGHFFITLSVKYKSLRYVLYR